MTEIQTEWKPFYLISGYFQQDKYWIDADGEIHEIATINTHYCLNILCFIERLAPNLYYYANGSQGDISEASRWLVGTPLYKTIKERVKENLNNV